MTIIRVDPEKLRKSAALMLELSQQAGGLSSRAWDLTSNAPSHDGQFGPQVQAIGAEASARIAALTALLAAREEYLTAKAEAFDAADQAVVASFAAVLPPVFNLGEFFGIPQWVIDFIVAMIPFGDLVDILAQLKKWIVGEEVDDLVMCLAILGLLMDLGYVEPTPGGEGGNALAAILKAIAKAIPKGPVRDALTNLLKKSLKNLDEAGRLVRALWDLAKRGKVFGALLEKNPKAFVELLEAGPDAVRVLLRYSDDVILKYVDEVASLPRGIGHSNFLQGLQVSELAQRYGVDIHLCGRLADTPAEQAFRVQLANEARQLMKEEGISKLEAQFKVAEKYSVDFFQVKPSSVGDLKDVDLFIPDDQWQRLLKENPDAAEDIKEAIADIYGIDLNDVDFYQTLEPVDPVKAGLPPGRYTIPDPKTNIPPGSVEFRLDGKIEHPPIVSPGSPFRQLIEETWGLELWP
jgi:hypothetical protein